MNKNASRLTLNKQLVILSEDFVIDKDFPEVSEKLKILQNSVCVKPKGVTSENTFTDEQLNVIKPFIGKTLCKHDLQNRLMSDEKKHFTKKEWKVFEKSHLTPCYYAGVGHMVFSNSELITTEYSTLIPYLEKNYTRYFFRLEGQFHLRSTREDKASYYILGHNNMNKLGDNLMCFLARERVDIVYVEPGRISKHRRDLRQYTYRAVSHFIDNTGKHEVSQIYTREHYGHIDIGKLLKNLQKNLKISEGINDIYRNLYKCSLTDIFTKCIARWSSSKVKTDDKAEQAESPKKKKGGKRNRTKASSHSYTIGHLLRGETALKG